MRCMDSGDSRDRILNMMRDGGVSSVVIGVVLTELGSLLLH
jgi:hypothetical protein